MNTLITKPVFMLACLLAAMPCAASAETNPAAGKGELAEVAGENAEMGLLEALRTSGYTVFAELLEITGVAADLDGDNPLTCFAPANEAFNPATVAKIRETPDDPSVRELLRYHLIDAPLSKGVIMRSRRVKTLNGKFLLFWVGKDGISLNDHSKLVKPDIQTSAGVIHGVSEVIRWDVPGAIP